MNPLLYEAEASGKRVWGEVQENRKIIGHEGTVILSEAKDLISVLGACFL